MNHCHAYRPDIEGLRAVAVLSVMVFHALPDVLPGGFLGVDVFFVISGYLITAIILRDRAEGRFRMSQFYERRARRILPALFLMLAATAAAAVWVMQPQELMLLAQSLMASVAPVSNVYFWRQSGYFNEAAGLQPLLHTWSLAVEEQFYLLYPLLLYLIWRWPPRTRDAVLGMVTLLSFGWCVWLAKRQPEANFFLLQSRGWELLVGAMLASRHAGQPHELLQPAGANRSAASLLGMLGLFMVVGSLAWMDESWGLPNAASSVVVLGTAALIHAGRHGAGPSHRLLSRPLMVWVGGLSYSLYLWHQPVFSLAKLKLGESLPVAQALPLLGVTALLAWISWRWVETPWRRPSTGSSGSFLISLLLIAVVLALGGAWVNRQQGLVSLAPEHHRRLMNHVYDYSDEYRMGRCFLRDNQTPDDFQPCQIRGDHAGVDVLLWGDSHAAHLWPGLSRQTHEFDRLTQRTAGGCPPLIDAPGATVHCRRIQERVLQELKKQRPDRLLLAARWSDRDLPALARTLLHLRALGVPHITVVGLTPRWRGGLPGWLSLHSTDLQRLPLQLEPVNMKAMQALNQRLRSVSEAAGVDFADALAALCPDAPLCRTTTHGTLETLMYWDAAHLTRVGSEFLLGRLRLWRSPTSARSRTLSGAARELDRTALGGTSAPWRSNPNATASSRRVRKYSTTIRRLRE